MKKVAVIMGSDSDLPVLKGAFETLRQLNIPFEAHVYSAHRTPAEAAAFASAAAENGFGVLIAAAGKAAHLAGALAAQTVLPVIGIPVKSSTLGHARGHGGHRRRCQRGAVGGADPGRERCGAGREAARHAAEAA